MARKFFRRFMPSQDRVATDKKLRWLKPILNKPYLWHLNRHSVARAAGFGFFWAMIPIPGQSIPAVYTTLKARGNVPLALAFTWLSNPVTLIPHWWTAYVIGKFLLQRPDINIEFSRKFLSTLSFGWFLDNFWNFYLPLLVGSVIEGAALGVAGYFFVNAFWKIHVRRKWRQSRKTAALRPSVTVRPPVTVP